MSPEPGPLADEAARLVEAVRLWWASAGPPAEPYPTGEQPPWWSSEAAATHTGPECRACPVCRLIAAARSVRPEVVEHLLAASSSLVAAVRAAVDPPEPPPAPGPGPGPGARGGPASAGPGVEHIDIA